MTGAGRTVDYHVLLRDTWQDDVDLEQSIVGVADDSQRSWTSLRYNESGALVQRLAGVIYEVAKALIADRVLDAQRLDEILASPQFEGGSVQRVELIVDGEMGPDESWRTVSAS